MSRLNGREGPFIAKLLTRSAMDVYAFDYVEDVIGKPIEYFGIFSSRFPCSRCRLPL